MSNARPQRKPFVLLGGEEMQIEATWSKPIKLKKSKSPKLIYEIDIAELPAVPGVYVFGRKHGSSVVPIYIGETMTVRGRVKNHLNSLALMKEIENAPNGERFFMYCTVKTRSADRAKAQVKILEKALILHAQTEGHVLFNKRGTKLPTDEITFSGNRVSEAIAPRVMLIKRALTKSKAAAA
jgi:hypothetical protein